jgi:hypothetical protein
MRGTATIDLAQRQTATRRDGPAARTGLRRGVCAGTWEEAHPFWPVRLLDGRWCLGFWTTIPVERRRDRGGFAYRERPESDADAAHRLW